MLQKLMFAKRIIQFSCNRITYHQIHNLTKQRCSVTDIFFSLAFHDNGSISNRSSAIKLMTTVQDSVAEEKALEIVIENFEIRQVCIYTII